MCSVPTAPAGAPRAEVGADGKGRDVHGGGARVEGIQVASILQEGVTAPPVVSVSSAAAPVREGAGIPCWHSGYPFIRFLYLAFFGRIPEDESCASRRADRQSPRR